MFRFRGTTLCIGEDADSRDSLPLATGVGDWRSWMARGVCIGNLTDPSTSRRCALAWRRLGGRKIEQGESRSASRVMFHTKVRCSGHVRPTFIGWALPVRQLFFVSCKPLFEPELHLGDDIVVPDLAGWRRETMPEYPDAAYCTIAPDWVCEVLSPSTRQLDQGGKRDLYAREGVRHLWFVDPDARTLEAFELREGHWLLLTTLVDDVPVSLPPFDAITFPLDALWPEVTSGAGNGEKS